MSASRAEKRGAELARGEHDRTATTRGHVMEWKLGEGANRRGQAYFWLGTCTACDATVTVGDSWSSSYGPSDARKGRCRMAAPPERATATRGLVLRQFGTGWILMHAPSVGTDGRFPYGTPLHRHGIRLQRDAQAAAVMLGQLGIDWAQGGDEVRTAIRERVQGGVDAVSAYLHSLQDGATNAGQVPAPSPVPATVGASVVFAGGRR